jgi:hypothetical protein
MRSRSWPAWVEKDQDLVLALDDFLTGAGNDNALGIDYPPGVTSYRDEVARIVEHCDMKQAVDELRQRFHSRPAYPWRAFVQSVIALVVLKGGPLPTMPIGKLRAERKEIAASVAKLRQRIALSEDPAVSNLSLADLVGFSADDGGPGQNLNSAIGGSGQAFLIYRCAGQIEVADLLHALEQRLQDEARALNTRDDSNRAPWDPERPGNPQAQRLLLERRLADHLSILDGDPANLIQTLAGIAIAGKDTRSTPFAKRRRGN